MKINRLHLAMMGIALSATAYAETAIEPTDTLSELIVTGTNNAMPAKLLPYSVTSVSQKQIEATGRTQLLSALSGRVPGLFVTERNIFGFGVSKGGSGGIKMRGIGGSPTSQVLMMVDGKPQFAGIYSHHVADNYESEYVDHVEIIRGPASVLYGSNAMGGAINVITKNTKEDGINTTLKSQYGSYNTWQTALTNTIRKGKFSSLISLGYDRTDGTEKGFDFWQASGYGKVGYDFSDNWNAYLDYSLMQFVGNDPIIAAQEGASKDYHQNIVRGEGSLVVSNSYSKGNGAVRLYFSHGNHHIQDPKPFHSLDDRFGLLAYQNFQPWKDNNMTLGFDVDNYTGRIPLSGGQQYTPKNLGTMSHVSICEFSPYYTVSQGFLNNLIVINGGIRMANSSLRSTTTQWLPQGGFAINPGKGWNLKANLSKGYRNPSFKEMYLYKMANPDLEPERMMNYEVSLGKSFCKYLSLEVTGYISKGDNSIQEIFVKDLGHKKYLNTGKFTNKGIEVAANSHPLSTLDLHATYSYLHSDIENLTGAPKHQYSFGADWAATPKLTVNADLVGVSRLFVVEDVNMQNYALLNLKVTYKIHKALDLFVQGYNLTDARYCINDGYEMPGITASGGFKLRF